MMEHSQFEGQLASKLHLENEADRDPMMAARFDDADTQNFWNQILLDPQKSQIGREILICMIDAL